MPKFKFRFITNFPEYEIDAVDLDDARKQVEQIKLEYADSKAGSDWLVNAELELDISQ